MEEQQESRSKFLIRNFINGFIWLVVIVVAFIFTEDFIEDNFQNHIDTIKESPVIMFSFFFLSEVVFGIIPPVLFMTTWKMLLNVSLAQYIIDLSILTIISFVSGVIGFYIGKNFSKTAIYRRVEERYLTQYNKQLKKYGVFLVIVGALTPVPFSGTCMLAGSVHIPMKTFILACSTRVFYFLIYGWVVWSSPGLFS
jgi:membrane protein DedA with SNARE-associated domain